MLRIDPSLLRQFISVDKVDTIVRLHTLLSAVTVPNIMPKLSSSNSSKLLDVELSSSSEVVEEEHWLLSSSSLK